MRIKGLKSSNGVSCDLDVCSYCFFLTDKGKASFLESEGPAILKMVMLESEHDESIDLVFEIITSLILDGK